MRKGIKTNIKSIADERVETLFKSAANEFKGDPKRSDRYVQLALRLIAKSGIRMPKKFRQRYCRKCKKYLVSGTNAKIRTRNGKLIIYCFNCKTHRRLVLNPKI
jgi:ribonuclease P protein subunit RPR2